MLQINTSRRSNRYRLNSEINITNLMDVMMVLLVVFMVAAPLMTSGIALDLPKVGGKNLEGEDTSIRSSRCINLQHRLFSCHFCSNSRIINFTR